MNIPDSILGTVTVQVLCADPAGFLSDLVYAGIPVIRTVFQNELTVLITVKRTDYRKLIVLSDKKGVSTKILKKSGLYWQIKELLHRPVLVGGILVLLGLTLLLPTRILFVRVEGNRQVPTRLILEQAANCGIRFGADRKGVRSEKMKNALLEAMPSLQWAGINTKGCTAVITVREREINSQPKEDSRISSIYAIRDGIISSVTVTRGNALCVVGQAVKEGQLLISGLVDHGLVIRGTNAQGEVYADTKHEVTTMMLKSWKEKQGQGNVTRRYALRIGKNLVFFQKDSGIRQPFCDRIYEEKYVETPGLFRLPISLVIETVTSYGYEEIQLDSQEVRSFLEDFSCRYLKEQMVAGQFHVRTFAFFEDDGVYRIDGQFACREMIGQVQKEEIVTSHEYSN